MKVLWITPLHSKINKNSLKETGGWIVSLLDAIFKYNSEIEIGVIYFDQTHAQIEKDDRVIYMPVKQDKSKWIKVIDRLTNNKKRSIKLVLHQIMNYVNTFKPDITHLWGIEHFHSSIIKCLADRPVVVHIQGLLTEIEKMSLPGGISQLDLKKNTSIIDRLLLKRGLWENYKTLQERAFNEGRLIPLVKYWIGRTEWDKTIINFLSPNSRYFHCNELLRTAFYERQWRYHYNGRCIQILSIISSEWYKGMDVILKTAQALSNRGVSYEWSIIGISVSDRKIRVIEKNMGVELKALNINFLGKRNALFIIDKAIESDVFVHPSYIENSCNAISEAMLLGVPIVAMNVGGNSSILPRDSGILVPPNDPILLADSIIKLTDMNISSKYSEKSRNISRIRHDSKTVCHDLINIYNEILGIEHSR